jgi:acetolactate synthase I/II/III large subunit
MLGNDFILRSLVADGVDHLFMMTGGLVDPFLPAIARVPELTPVVAAHEGGAAAMADGYARASGRIGACLCIGGPGLTNAVTSISAAYTDESPVLLITGEVENYMEGLGLFQDATASTYNDTDIVSPVTVQSYSIPDVRLVHHKYRAMIKSMLDGARRPAHLSVPRDVQKGEIDVVPEPVAPELLNSQSLDYEMARTFWEKGEGAARIVILVGGGVIADNASTDLVAAAERFGLPIATTEHAKGMIPEDHPLALGVFGYAGTPHATNAILGGNLDLLVVLGSTLNVRDSMYWTEKLAPKRGLLSVNISAVHVGCHTLPGKEQFVRGHGGAFLRWLLNSSDSEATALLTTKTEREAWISAIKKGPRFYDAENMTSDQQRIHPARMVAECRKAMPRDTIAIVDSGAHRAFAAHYWDSYGPREFITASNLGPMGWGIGAGIGAKAARPDRPVVVFTGDGCFRMHGMEVQTSARFGLPVIYCVSNNCALGNVWLRAEGLGEIPAKLNEAPDQDFAGFARAMGAEGITVKDPDELAAAFAKALELNKTVVIDVKTDRAAKTPVSPYHQGAEAWSYRE